jgi:hypothetical protein
MRAMEGLFGALSGGALVLEERCEVIIWLGVLGALEKIRR